LQLQPDAAGNVAIGSRLAEQSRRAGGRFLTIINPQGRSTPFGTVPRQIAYTVSAIFEIGVYDYDQAFVVMPMAGRADPAADRRFHRHDRSDHHRSHKVGRDHGPLRRSWRDRRGHRLENDQRHAVRSAGGGAGGDVRGAVDHRAGGGVQHPVL
jgi:hypothetical protein